MSLHIYDRKEDIPKETLFIDSNDIYFDANTKLLDNDFTRLVLKAIDKAEYVSEQTFTGRVKRWGALFKEHLSTGSKTLLNIQQHPEVCFNVAECGSNVKQLFAEIKDGRIYWEVPMTVLEKDCDCDFEYKGEKYTRYSKFLHYIRYGGDEASE